MPHDFCNAMIITLYNNKRSRTNCRNYWGMPLISITRKILAKAFMGLVPKVLFADDCALMAYDRNDLQVLCDRLSTAAKLFGLTISLRRQKVSYRKPLAWPRCTHIPHLRLMSKAYEISTDSDVLEVSFPTTVLSI